MAHLGGLAQLVERLLCKQDVSGSSPLTSTNLYFSHHQTNWYTAPNHVPFHCDGEHISLLGLPSENLENCI
jgi:hypothetical protein